MKSIKFIFVMAAVAVTLAFVSCSNEAQEVVISYSTTFYSYKYAGVVTGTVLSSSSNESVSVYSEDPLGSVKYYTGHDIGEEVNTNIREYKLTVPLKVINTYNGGTTYTPTTTTIDIEFRKIGDTYYYDNNKIELSGSPEDSEFTIKAVKTGSYIFSDLKFTRK